MEAILLEPMFELPGLDGVERDGDQPRGGRRARRSRCYIYSDRRGDVRASAPEPPARGPRDPRWTRILRCMPGSRDAILSTMTVRVPNATVGSGVDLPSEVSR